MQVVGSLPQGNALLDVYLVWPKISLVSCSIVQGNSSHCSVCLEVEWSEICHLPDVERLVPVHHTADALGLQNFLWDELARWAVNGSFAEIPKNFKETVFESI
jgi:hypothetical protein